MASYASISEVNEEIQKRLREVLVPDIVLSTEQVVLCSPASKGDASVGIFLYDIQENSEIRRNYMMNTGPDRQQYPPLYLTLYYMVTAYCAGDIRYRTEQESKILGRVLQYFHDHPVLKKGEPDVRIMFQSVSTEDKIKLWNFPDIPYKVSLFYQIAPVTVASAYTKEVNRVKSAHVHVSSREENR